MTALEKVKNATSQLDLEDQLELFRWWSESDVFKRHQLAALKRDLAVGLEDLDSGRYQTYSEADVMHLAEDIGRAGRERLKQKP